MREHGHHVRSLNTDRAAGELLTILSCGYSARAVRMMWECGLLEHVMPAHAAYIDKVGPRDVGREGGKICFILYTLFFLPRRCNGAVFFCSFETLYPYTFYFSLSRHTLALSLTCSSARES